MNRCSGILLQFVLTGVMLSTSCIAASEDGPVILRLEQQGGGMVQFYSTFELRENGVLDLMRRSPSGALIEKRRAGIEDVDLQRYRDLLNDGGYYSNAPKALKSDVVSRAAGEWQDIPSWRVEVFRDGNRVATTMVPPRVSGQLHPELREVPHVRVAWSLLEEFQKKWDGATKVGP